ncbi:MAG: hypothetical protein BZ138_08125 [Methanosphaera sp. rholeuAM270]|nr:MAG: hypothetical protein BZ138_08125 [Methanosphaera sp. rholeuAM270]
MKEKNNYVGGTMFENIFKKVAKTQLSNVKVEAHKAYNQLNDNEFDENKFIGSVNGLICYWETLGYNYDEDCAFDWEHCFKSDDVLKLYCGEELNYEF